MERRQGYVFEVAETPGGTAGPAPTSVPISDSPDFPLIRVLTSNTKLDDNVSFGAVHSSEGERRHSAPERESAGKGVVDHGARQVFRVILDPGRKRQEDKGQK